MAQSLQEYGFFQGLSLDKVPSMDGIAFTFERNRPQTREDRQQPNSGKGQPCQGRNTP
jgi:hypothetical protein